MRIGRLRRLRRTLFKGDYVPRPPFTPPVDERGTGIFGPTRRRRKRPEGK